MNTNLGKMIEYEEILQHSGIKGMKWGVRKSVVSSTGSTGKFAKKEIRVEKKIQRTNAKSVKFNNKLDAKMRNITKLSTSRMEKRVAAYIKQGASPKAAAFKAAKKEASSAQTRMFARAVGLGEFATRRNSMDQVAVNKAIQKIAAKYDK